MEDIGVSQPGNCSRFDITNRFFNDDGHKHTSHRQLTYVIGNFSYVTTKFANMA